MKHTNAIVLIAVVLLLLAVPVMAEMKVGTVDHNPTAWAYYTDADTFKDWGVGIDYKAFIRTQAMIKEESPWAYGAGVYAAYDKGSVKNSTYGWNAPLVAGQSGIQHISVDENEHVRQQQLMARLGYEWQSGKNAEGYFRKQDNVKLGGYYEVLQQIGEKNDQLIGFTLEGWWAINRKLKSSWPGDTLENRDSLGASLFYQKRFARDWAYRVGVNGFTDMHDVGGGAFAQLRYKETLSCGPRISSFSGVNSLTGICVVETGNKIRDWRREALANRVLKNPNEQQQPKVADKIKNSGTPQASARPVAVVTKGDRQYKTGYVSSKYKPNKKFDPDPFWYQTK